MKYLIPLLFFITACSGGSTTTSPTSATDPLSGTWRGTIQTAAVSQTEWTFRPIGNANVGYETVASLHEAQLPGQAILTTTLLGSQLHATGSYRSPFGCSVLLDAYGTASAKKIEAMLTNYGVCELPFVGQMTLSR